MGGRDGPGRGDRARVLQGHRDRVRRAHRAREPDQRGEPAPGRQHQLRRVRGRERRRGQRELRDHLPAGGRRGRLRVRLVRRRGRGELRRGRDGRHARDRGERVRLHARTTSPWAAPTSWTTTTASTAGRPSAPTGTPPNTATFGSALSYVPEIPWNDSCASQLIYSTPAIALGTYTQAYGATGFCNSTDRQGELPDHRRPAAAARAPYSAQPSWQTGVVGLPTTSGGKRVPAGRLALRGQRGLRPLPGLLHDGRRPGRRALHVHERPRTPWRWPAGGTSFASPSMAGIQALIDQKMGGEQGNPNYTYYKLAAAE